MNESASKESAIAAATHFAEFDDEDELDLEVASKIFHALGFLGRRGGIGFRRAVYLCFLACYRYEYAWSGMGCTPPGPRRSMEAVEDWLTTGEFLPDHAQRRMPELPLRNGEVVADCDAPCLNQLASAAARTAYFCRTQSVIDASLALCDIRGAVLEGLEHADGRDFGDWLIGSGVVRAFDLDGLPGVELA